MKRLKLMIYMEPQVYMRVASFDIGLKNMSLCVLDFNKKEFEIKKWTNLSLRGKNISDYTRDTIEKLRMLNFGCLDYVLIEQQVNRNTQMKVLSHVVQTFFISDLKLPPTRVIFVSPKIRLDSSSLVHGTVVATVKQELGLQNEYSRKEFKKLSIAIAEKYLLSERHGYWYSFFVNEEKKDDYADSFVQAISWNYSNSVMDID